MQSSAECRKSLLSAPLVRGDSSQCEEMSRSDRGDRRRQRLSRRSRDWEILVGVKSLIRSRHQLNGWSPSREAWEAFCAKRL